MIGRKPWTVCAVPFIPHGLFISKGPIVDRLEENFSEFEKEVLCTQTQRTHFVLIKNQGKRPTS